MRGVTTKTVECPTCGRVTSAMGSVSHQQTHDGSWNRARIFAFVRVRDSGCWLWTGSLTRGYGRVGLNNRVVYAHRAIYEMERGPIPEGMTLDHLCRVRACVNPAHLEPVTSAENTRRGSEVIRSCPHGHPYSEANTYRTNGHRQCRTCHRLRERARRHERMVVPDSATFDEWMGWAGINLRGTV